VLTRERTRLAAAAAHRLAMVAAASLADLAQSLRNIAERPQGDRAALRSMFARLHPAAREQVLEVLERNGIVHEVGFIYAADAELAAAGAVALETLAYAAERAGPTLPCVYVSPPDLLAEMTEDAGEIRQLLIELVAGARRRVSIVTPFFSEIALLEILAPLGVPGVRPEVILYLSVAAGEQYRARHLLRVIGERFPAHKLTLFLNERPAQELAALPHAKLLLRDSAVGYLGSANISLHGLREQFEAGVRLEAGAVRALEQALDGLVRRGEYVLIGSIEARKVVAS
jgi:hypothetical protein